MINRIHKEKVRVGTTLLNKYTIIIGVIGFILYLLVGITSSVVTRFDPGFHADSDFPVVYKVFLAFLIIYCIILLVLLFFNIFKIFKEWKKIITRHKTFLSISFYFFISLFLISLTGFYSSYDHNGIRILMVIFLNNIYVFIL